MFSLGTSKPEKKLPFHPRGRLILQQPLRGLERPSFDSASSRGLRKRTSHFLAFQKATFHQRYRALPPRFDGAAPGHMSITLVSTVYSIGRRTFGLRTSRHRYPVSEPVPKQKLNIRYAIATSLRDTFTMLQGSAASFLPLAGLWRLKWRHR